MQVTYHKDSNIPYDFDIIQFAYNCITQQKFQLPQVIYAQCYLEIMRAIVLYWILSLTNEHVLFTC